MGQTILNGWVISVTRSRNCPHFFAEMASDVSEPLEMSGA
jgi:hypothetical protein